MSYCRNCGRWIADETIGCIQCGLNETGSGQAMFSSLDHPVSQDQEEAWKDTSRFSAGKNTILFILLKILGIAVVWYLEAIGAVLCLVVGSTLKRSKNPDYVSLGKFYIKATWIMIIITLVLGVLFYNTDVELTNEQVEVVRVL